jgi:hypothetical protein
VALAVEVDLTRNNRVVVATYSGRITPADIATTVEKIKATIQQATLPVHNLSDLLQVTALPPNIINSMRVFRDLYYDPMFGSVALVSSNLFFDAIASAFVRTLPNVRIRVYKTVPVAWNEMDRLLQGEAT